MQMITLEAVRLGDARPMCGGELLLEAPLPAAVLRELLDQLFDSGEGVAAELVLASAGGSLLRGLNLRVRAEDPMEDVSALNARRDALCGQVSSWLRNRGVRNRLKPPAEPGTVSALPERDFIFLRKQRFVGNAANAGTYMPIHYFAAASGLCRMDAAAIERRLMRHPGSGISLELFPMERTDRERKNIDAVIRTGGSQEYQSAYSTLRDAKRNWGYVALVWGGAAEKVQEILRAGGLEFRAVRLEEDALLRFETALNPWAVHARLVRKVGSEEMGRIACSFTDGELDGLLEGAPDGGDGEADILSLQVRPDAEKLRQLNDITGSVLGGGCGLDLAGGGGAQALGDVMRALGELSGKLDGLGRGTNFARVADLERLREELKNDILSQARAAFSAQSAQLADAVRSINAHAEAQADRTVEAINDHADARTAAAAGDIKAHAEALTAEAVRAVNAHTDEQLAPLVEGQREAFERLFREAAANEERIEALMERLDKVAVQVGLSAKLSDQDLRLMGCASEEELIAAGLPADLLESLRYAVALYRLAGRMELSDDADCLPFGFMLGCLYEQLMTRLFNELFVKDPEHLTPPRLKTYDMMDGDRIRRYARGVRFADGSALTELDWIAWFNVFYSVRQLRNRVHAEAGRLRRTDLDCMFRALFSDASGSRANLIAQNYSRTDENGVRTERVFIPYEYRDDAGWGKAPGYQEWSDVIANYIRSNPAPFERSLMQFIIACGEASWR